MVPTHPAIAPLRGRPRAARALRWLGESRAVVALLALLGLAVVLRAQRRPEPPPAVQARFVERGVAIDLAIDAADPGRRGAPLRAGDDVTFRFKVSDATTGAPLARAFPVAWVDGRRPGETGGAKSCHDKVRSFLDNGLFGRAETDLNEYQVLVLNDDATISVVDPRFGFGGSKLLSMVFLRSPGVDWALTEDGRRLFVAMPAARRVAVVDTLTWAVTAEIDAKLEPGRILLQPDGGYLWVLGQGGGADAPAVTVISARDLRIVGTIGAGGGARALAFSDDSRTAFLTRRDAGTVAIVDVQTLAVVREIAVGRAPVAVAYSALARAAYVADAEDGGVTVIDAEKREISARIPTGPGLAGIAFDPAGRRAIAFSTEQERLQIIDASTNRVAQTAVLEGGPDQITFSDTLAYVRRRGDETVSMIPFDQALAPGGRTPAADFPGGQAAPGPASLPANIVSAPGNGSVLVANATDKAIYFYKEGMAAPMGHFDTYGRTPRGVLVLDHSLRERAPGVYETTARLGSGGLHDVAFLLDSPRTVHCFPIDVTERAMASGIAVALVAERQALSVGSVNQVRVRVRDVATGEPRSDLRDVTVLAYLAPGIWQTREHAEPEGDGVYAITITPPRAGVYSLIASSPSAGLEHGAPLTLMAERGGSAP